MSGETNAPAALSLDRVNDIKRQLLDCRAIAALRLGELHGLAYFIAEMIERERGAPSVGIEPAPPQRPEPSEAFRKS